MEFAFIELPEEREARERAMRDDEELDIQERARYHRLGFYNNYREASRLAGITNNIEERVRHFASLAMLENALAQVEQATVNTEAQGQQAQASFNTMELIVENGIIRANRNNRADWLDYWKTAESYLRSDGNGGLARQLRMTLRFVSDCHFYLERIRTHLENRRQADEREAARDAPAHARRQEAQARRQEAEHSRRQVVSTLDALRLDTENKRREFYILYSKYKEIYRRQGKSNEILKIPEHFKCPISLDIMMNPLYYKDIRNKKFSYEELEIKEWLVIKRNSTDPQTREPLNIDRLQQDSELIQEITQFQAELQGIVENYEAIHGLIIAPDSSNDDDNFASGKKYRKRKQTKQIHRRGNKITKKYKKKYTRRRK